MVQRNTRLLAALANCIFVLSLTLLIVEIAEAQSSTFKVAVVQFRPVLKDVISNRATIVASTTRAAKAGANIVVQTEMATSGYSFFSREDIATVAETIPGPTTVVVGKVALRYKVYVVVGLPERDKTTGRFYNTAVLIGPRGQVLAKYRKRSHLLESSWASIGEGKVPVVRTPFGRIAMAICADLYYPEIARSAAIAGARLLLVPTNGGFDQSLVQVRAFENDLTIALADRYGEEEKGTPKGIFSQESFTIPLPFAYNFNFGPESAVVSPGGVVLAHSSGAQDAIVLGEVRTATRHLPVGRRPELYSVLGQDTLEDYTFRSMGLPKPTSVIVGAAKLDSTMPLAAAVQSEILQMKALQPSLQLIVFPAHSVRTTDVHNLTEDLLKIAQANQIDIVMGVLETEGSKNYSTSLFVGNDGKSAAYREVHGMTRNTDLGSSFLVIDRAYARISFLGGDDLLAPEATLVLAKLGVDLIAVSADSDLSLLSAICRVRTTDGLELIVANKHGTDGIYQNDFNLQPDQMFVEKPGDVMASINTISARTKKELRRFDGWDDLLRH